MRMKSFMFVLMCDFKKGKFLIVETFFALFSYLSWYLFTWFSRLWASQNCNSKGSISVRIICHVQHKDNSLNRTDDGEDGDGNWWWGLWWLWWWWCSATMVIWCSQNWKNFFLFPFNFLNKLSLALVQKRLMERHFA